MLGSIGRLIGRVSDIGGWLAGAALVLITGLVFAEVVLRNLFGRSTMIADEVSGYLNVAAVFLGLGYTLKHGGFIRVEAVYQRLRGGWKAAAQWLIVVASLGYTVVMLFYMWAYVRYSYGSGLVSTSVTQTPLYIPQSLIVVGAVMLSLQLLAYVLHRMRDLP